MNLHVWPLPPRALVPGVVGQPLRGRKGPEGPKQREGRPSARDLKGSTKALDLLKVIVCFPYWSIGLNPCKSSLGEICVSKLLKQVQEMWLTTGLLITRRAPWEWLVENTLWRGEVEKLRVFRTPEKRTISREAQMNIWRVMIDDIVTHRVGELFLLRVPFPHGRKFGLPNSGHDCSHMGRTKSHRRQTFVAH